MDIKTTDLREKAKWVWRETLAIHRRAQETRLASSLSPIEIFVALYYGGVLQFYPKEPLSERRDRCIISKGHGSICMYPILSDLGYFSKEELKKVGEAGSFLGGIPDPIIPGYETVNGSLGHGLGVASGMAFGLKRKGGMKQNVFVIVGDGELHEGANWEAIMFASQHNLDNLHMVIDNNQICMLGYTDEIVSHVSLSGRLTAFGWEVVDVDGHDVFAVQKVLKNMISQKNSKPKALIARTLKGCGVPEMENAPLSHVMSLDREIIDCLLEKKQ